MINTDTDPCLGSTELEIPDIIAEATFPQPELRTPGPPKSPALPRPAASASSEPPGRILLSAQPNTTLSNVRAFVSQTFSLIGLKNIAEMVAVPDLISLKGPIEVKPGKTVALGWHQTNLDHLSMMVARVPAGIALGESDSKLFRLIRNGGNLTLIKTREALGHLIITGHGVKSFEIS